MELNLPEFDNEFFCIVNRDNPILAAIISSYIFKSGKYTLMFEYSNVEIENGDYNENKIDEYIITRTRAQRFNFRINRVLKNVGGCDYLILAGLSEHQKSYLNFLNDFNVIEIDTLEDVETFLQPIVNKNEYVACNENDIYNGLYIAAQENSLLKIDNSVESIDLDLEKNREGLIIVEKINAVSNIIAVNYSLSINANLKMIERPKISHKEIKSYIEKWKDGDINSYNDLSALLYNEIQDINFNEYKFSTFFTKGAPYSLILKNVIPITHVNLLLNPDFFIFNNLYFEHKEKIHSSIVFSPLEFGKDEEIDFVIDKLKSGNHFVKELIGREASVYNISNHVKEFPYELLHICSHGGEVNGFSLVEEYKDADGDTHIVEYDEVVSFAPHKNQDRELIPVMSKLIIRKFDGMNWGSNELKSKNYPHYVFSDMMNELFKNEGKSRKRKSIIPDSHAIKCSDFNYQAEFDKIANFQTFPFIFNNTCWSWSGVSDSFLASGARAYIGTLWSINNDIAKRTGESFYEKLFNGTILEALQKSLICTDGTNDENIYVFWGLHFSSVSTGVSLKKSKETVVDMILHAFYHFRAQLKTAKTESAKKEIVRLVNWNYNQLFDYFPIDAIKLLLKRR